MEIKDKFTNRPFRFRTPYRGLKCPSSPYLLELAKCVWAVGVPHQLRRLLSTRPAGGVAVTGLRHRLPLVRGSPVLLLGLRRPLSRMLSGSMTGPTCYVTQKGAASRPHITHAVCRLRYDKGMPMRCCAALERYTRNRLKGVGSGIIDVCYHLL